MDDNFGDDIASLCEDILVNLMVWVNLLPDVEVGLLKLCVMEAPAQNRVDLKFIFLALYVMIMKTRAIFLETET